MENRWVFGMRWIPGIDVDRARLRTTLAYRFAPTFMAGIEYNPFANDVGPIANWIAVPEKDDWPALILGTSSDRIGTPSGRAVYATLSKDLEEWTHLPIAPYAGVSYGTFDDEAVFIGGLAIQWSQRWSTTSLWDGHNLHHIIEAGIDEQQMIGVVIVELDGKYDVGVSYSISF
jgi:hypothetical protein